MEPLIPPHNNKIISTKDPFKIPVIDDVYPHFSINAEKEAQELLQKSLPILQSHDHLLILGLGLGHHVKVIFKEMQKRYDQLFKIMVIEPHFQLITDMRILWPLEEGPQLQILSHPTIDELYGNQDFIDFLMKKPGILYHKASLNIDDSYFKKLICYSAKEDLAHIIDLINEDHLLGKKMKLFLSSFPKDWSLKHVADCLSSKENKKELQLSSAILLFDQL